MQLHQYQHLQDFYLKNWLVVQNLRIAWIKTFIPKCQTKSFEDVNILIKDFHSEELKKTYWKLKQKSQKSFLKTLLLISRLIRFLHPEKNTIN